MCLMITDVCWASTLRFDLIFGYLYVYTYMEDSPWAIILFFYSSILLLFFLSTRIKIHPCMYVCMYILLKLSSLSLSFFLSFYWYLLLTCLSFFFIFSLLSTLISVVRWDVCISLILDSRFGAWGLMDRLSLNYLGSSIHLFIIVLYSLSPLHLNI